MKTYLTLSLLIFLYSLSCSLFAQDKTAFLKLIDTSGCNLAISERQGDNSYLLSNTSKVHNWFSGDFQNIDTVSQMTFIIDMKDTGNLEATGDVSKWEGLWPVYTYGKYWDYNSYIYYTKNTDGYWVSSDPFLIGAAKLAGNDITPVQSVIPKELAEEFLSADSTYWSAWAEIQDTLPNARDHTFSITKQFHKADAAIAMRYPYTYDYELEFMKRLQSSDIPGITVRNIGKSIRQHNLYVVEACDPTASEEELKDRRVILIYGNEDGDEPDSSWVVDGALKYLIKGLNLIKYRDNGGELTGEEMILTKEIRSILDEVTFLFIPLLDPVGWANSTYGEITYKFNKNSLTEFDVLTFKLTYLNPRSEVLNYAAFINNWCGEKGRRLDVAVNLHNIECSEEVNVLCPLIELSKAEHIRTLNKFVLSRLKDKVLTSDTVWMYGHTDKRFMGWCSEIWGTLPIPYEINSRYPQNRLSLDSLNTLGADFVKIFAEYTNSEGYERAFPEMERTIALHRERRDKKEPWKDSWDVNLRNYDILTGYN